MTTASRSEALPDIPILGDFVPGFEASTWFGVWRTKKHPPEIIASLNKAIQGVSSIPNEGALTPIWAPRHLPAPPPSFGKLIAEETEKWGKVVKSVGIKVQ